MGGEMRWVNRCMMLLIVVGLGGCGEQGSNEQLSSLIGAGGGAVFGGLLGNKLGHGSAGATALGAGAGALTGLLIGGAIGRELDHRDQQRASEATAATLQTGGTHSWKSDHSNASGKAVVLNTTHATNGKECRNVRETAYVQSQQLQQDAKYCRNADGEWVAA
jgi:surface antigen